ncbi:MAG: PDZ domain-containing protein [Planctomycetota bacterium]|nr:MAG: PDZ domain-containing protein [Planctomycetota bacterium]
MKKGGKLYICKALFVGKLALTSVLLFMAVKLVMLPAHMQVTLSPLSALAREKVPATEATDAPVLLLDDYAEIVERNPFRLSEKQMRKNQQTSMTNSLSADDYLSEQLGLALIGTISGNPVVARAIIKTLKTGGLDLYRVGQTVEEARIESIESDTVILLHNGQRKVLKLDILRSAGNSDNGVKPLSSQTARDVSKAVKTNLPDEETLLGVQTKKRYMETILDEAMIEPYVVDSQTEGLKITGIENIKAAKDLGLKNGDVIHTVNGHRLTSRKKAYQVFKKAKSEPSVRLELIRNGEIETLSFSLR